MTRANDWAGTVGGAWASEWQRTDRSFAELSRHLDTAILAAAPVGPFRALDIGCGAGGTSLALAEKRSDAAILGIDLSADLVAVAKERGEAAQASFIAGDAPALAADHVPFDLLYSRHGVMFFDDPVAAFTAFHNAAAPGAALVFSCFADWSDNAFAAALAEAIGAPPPVPQAPGSFAFADRGHVASILAAAGWRDATATRVPFTYRAGEGAGEAAVTDALSFFKRIGPAAPVLRAADPANRLALIERVTAAIAAHHTADAIDFPAAAWIWSARA